MIFGASQVQMENERGTSWLLQNASAQLRVVCGLLCSVLYRYVILYGVKLGAGVPCRSIDRPGWGPHHGEHALE